jgi:importin subunit alpha-6/7
MPSGSPTVNRARADAVIAAGVLQPLITILDAGTSRPCPAAQLQATAAWTLSNLCRGKPGPPADVLERALPVLSKLLRDRDGDADTIATAAWCLSYLSDGDNEQIEQVLNANVAQRLVELLVDPTAPDAVMPALRSVGNLVSGSDAQTQVLLDCGCLAALHKLMCTHLSPVLIKEVCWALSNITAGTSEQVDAVFTSGCLEPIIVLLDAPGAMDIQREAAWAVTNSTASGHAHHAVTLVRLGCLPPMCALLRSPDAKLVLLAMEGIENVLRVESSCHPESAGGSAYAIIIEESGGRELLEHLSCCSSSPEVCDKAAAILQAYFDVPQENLERRLDTVPGPRWSHSAVSNTLCVSSLSAGRPIDWCGL